eukprot:655620-Prymnesium_polylepis.1
MLNDGRDSLLGGGVGSSSAPGNDRLSHVQNQVNEVREVMQQNVDVMLENMEKTTALESSSAELANQANAFRVNARRTRKKMWWQNFKMKLAI